MKRFSILFMQGPSICAALIFVILSSGCATTIATKMYPGSALPKEQAAIIEGKDTRERPSLTFFPPYCNSHVRILDVDGQHLSPTQKCEVLPGLHNVVIQVEYKGSTGGLIPWDNIEGSKSVSLQFNAEAGHQYRISMRYWSIGYSQYLKKPWKAGPHVLFVDAKSKSFDIIDVTTGATIFSKRFCK
jgi:hypothetical protein